MILQLQCRYTEVRLSKIAEELLADIDKDTLILFQIMMNPVLNQVFYLQNFQIFC